MLTRSIFVRRLIPTDKDLFIKDPTNYVGEWTTDSNGEVGEVVSENFLPVPTGDQGMVIMQATLGVCWWDTPIPAISYELPAFLEYVELDEDEDEEESE